jgi:hypothetical protein
MVPSFRVEPPLRGARADRGASTKPLERRRGFSLRDQFRLLIPLLVVWAMGCAVLAMVATRRDVGELLLDPTWVGGAAWYAGIVSQFGAVAWCVAATSAAWSSWVASFGGRLEAVVFLRRGSLVTLVLLSDDLFGFHSGVLEQIGLPKVVGEMLVLGPLVLWLMAHLRDIVRTRWQLLVASLTAQAVSFLVDFFVNPGRHDFAVLFEDGPKFLGILAWSTYFVVTARDIARSVMRGEFANRSLEAEATAFLRTSADDESLERIDS